MSFMFHPHPYDEPTAINRPALSERTKKALIKGGVNIANAIADKANEKSLIVLDGYASAEFSQVVNLLGGILEFRKIKYEVINVSCCYKTPQELDELFADNLKVDLEKDPVSLFGKRLEDGYNAIFDADKVADLQEKLATRENVVILYGYGSMYHSFVRNAADITVYLDVAPKNVVLRAKNGKMTNIGDVVAKPFKAMMRRAYYVDFEAALLLRRELIGADLIDFYVDSTDLSCYKMVDREAFAEITGALSVMPIRNKPVYLEGVWGGQYVKSVRNVPDCMKNIAWVFDFIPMEVSVVTEVGEDLFEMPFYTLLQKRETELMGQACVDKFGGYFPIRFNYDDTFHSSGNMSIQVHSGSDYNKENYNEFGRQDESYYIVNAGHGARTYLGFANDQDPKEFIELAKKSEKDHSVIDYQKYIHAVESKPGVQVMIPAGTIHASGRNQLILEIGSLTVGSYTYKMYDYLRPDIDGKPRPIHTYHGENVLRTERNADWIHENVVQQPRTVRKGEGYEETILGEHDLLYFSLRHLCFEKEVEDDTNGKFHVLSLVDGEHVRIESAENPDIFFEQHFLDVVLVPASMGKYRIVNLGNHPITIHKTCLKEGFEQDEL